MKLLNTRYSIKFIFTLILILGILVPILLTNTFFFNTFSKTYNEDHKKTITLNAQSLNYSLDQYFSKYSIIFDVLSEGEVWDDFTEINDSLSIEEVKTLYSDITLENTVESHEEFAEDYRALVNLITAYEADDSIKTIYIGTPEKYVYTNNIGEGNTVLYGYNGETFDCTSRPWYIGAVEKGTDIHWSIPYVDKDNETIVLSASKTILDENDELIGVISMDIHIDNFTEEILSFKFDETYSSFIIDKNGQYIIADSKDIGSNIENEELITFLSSDETFIEINKTTYTKIQNTESDWYIIQTFSQNQVTEDLRNLVSSAWYYGVALLVIIILISHLLSNVYLRPINTLTNHFKKIDEKKDISIRLLNKIPKQNNEIGLLFNSVQNMQSSVQDSLDKVEYLSYHDQLTAINNRAFFEKELVKLNNKEFLPLSIVMIDVNGLKLINDAFGHSAGDDLLKITSSILSENIRDNDVLARWGGDEFVLLLPNTSLDAAKEITDSVIESTKKIKFKYGDVSLAMGVATKKEIDQDMFKIFRLAEEIMYQEKNNVASSVRSETINTIINTLFEKSPETKDHSIRVSELAEAIAIEMNLPQNRVNDIKTIGTIHDIGKIVIDSSILEKKSPLTKKEREIIYNHSLIGSRMLSSTHEYTRLAPGVLHHHEKMDGTGYPNNLKGDQIPLESRIISVADAFDAMISDRPYKKIKMEITDAIAELTRCSGTQFDKEITTIFIEKVIPKFYSL